MTFPQRRARWLKWFDQRSGHSSGTALRIAAVSLWVLVLGAGYALLISWLDPALPWPVKLEREPWFLTILNVVPVLMLCALLTVVTGRVVLASWLTLLVLALLYAINAAKVAQLATPLLPEDLFFLRELRLNYAFFSTYLASGVTPLLIAAVIVAITLALTREAVLLRLSGSRRVLSAVAILGAGVSLLYGAGPWNQLYNPGRLQFEPWAPADSAQRTGLITNLILLHWELQVSRTAEPDVVAATRLLEDVDNSAVRSVELAGPVGDLPDIIVVQSESLFDPSRLNAVADSHLPNLRSWSNRGWSGDLKVPTFGGGTIRTEFEMLTGLPLEAFPEVRYPYLQLPRKQVPSFVRTLGAHGYRSLAIHPNGGAFWNRNQAFHAFGFDRFIDGKAFAGSAREGWYVSDAALTDRVIAELQDEGPPQFIMAISIQNHGPYTLSRADDPAADATLDIVPASLEATSAAAWQTYLRLLRRSDAELGRLATYLQQRERRTLLLFYSDHMPPLNMVFASVGFADGRPAQQQPVPWLLLDNRSSQQRSENTASWLLPALLLTKAGIRGRDYFDFREALRERWTEAELRTDEMRLGIAAVAQLQYRDELQSTMQRRVSRCGRPECSDPR
jgi:phosphoglycerol transferase MdoB-like AlkP superfamily enzyme